MAITIDGDGTITGLSAGGLPDNSVQTADIADNQITTGKIGDNQVTLAKMAGGTDGQIITYDASGDPVAVGPGTDGQLLTSTGAGSPPAFEDAPAGGAAGPCIVAYIDAGEISISNSTWTKVQLDNRTIGDTGMWSEADERFTPTTAGIYFCQFEGMMTSGNSDLEIKYEFRKNGNGGHSYKDDGAFDIYQSPWGGTSHPSFYMGNGTLISFNGSSDYVECWVYHTGGGARSLHRPRFVAFKVDTN